MTIELLATHLEAAVLATELVKVGAKWSPVAVMAAELHDKGDLIRFELTMRQADHLFDSAKRSIRTDLALSAAYDRAYPSRVEA